jgi:subtilase family serine protease
MRLNAAVIAGTWMAFTDPLFRASADAILKLAAAKGIAVNLSSGDSGNSPSTWAQRMSAIPPTPRMPRAWGA